MIYLDTKDDSKFILQFSQTFEHLRQIEVKAQKNLRARDVKWLGSMSMFQGIREEANNIDVNYAGIRANFTKMMHRAIQITNEQGVNHRQQIQSAPIEGNRIFNGSIYDAVLDPPSALIDFDTIFRDTINQVIGILEWKQAKEFRHLVNPFYWLKELIVFLVRLPHILISVSGLDVKKVEEHFIGKLSQLVYVIALILLAARLGISVADIIQLIIGTFKP